MPLERARLAVAREADELDLDIELEMANQVRHEDDRALQHADEDDLLAVVVGVEAIGDGLDRGVDFVAVQVLREVLIVDHAHGKHSVDQEGPFSFPALLRASLIAPMPFSPLDARNEANGAPPAVITPK